METKKDYIPAIGIAVIVICLTLLLTMRLNADEPTKEQNIQDVKLQQKTAKQKKLEAEIEALVSTPLSNEEILGEEEYVNNKHKGGK